MEAFKVTHGCQLSYLQVQIVNRTCRGISLGSSHLIFSQRQLVMPSGIEIGVQVDSVEHVRYQFLQKESGGNANLAPE